MEGENNIRTISPNSKAYKSFTEPKFISGKRIYNLDSLTDINTNTKSIKLHSDNTKIKKKFPRSISVKTYFDHYDKKNCEYCEGIDSLVEDDKSKLSSFIQDNSKFLKLFGNRRYNRSSPYLFVEDHKCGKDYKFGLVPIPSKPRVIMKSPEENTKLYEIQRRIVMVRRYQYGKRNFSEPNRIQYIDDEYTDENSLDKIILIQKIFRGYIIREKVAFILNFKILIYRFQEILDKIKAKRFLRYLFNYEEQIEPDNENIKGSNYISKIERNKKNNLENFYQKNNNLIYRNNINKNKENEKQDNIFQNISDLKKYSKKIVPKGRLKNNSDLLNKDYYDLSENNEYFNKKGNNNKYHFNPKKNLVKKNNNNDNINQKGLFINKITFSEMVQKVVNFNNIMRNALQKAVFRKKPTKIKLELEQDINNNNIIKREIPQVDIYLDDQINNNNPEPEKIIESKNIIIEAQENPENINIKKIPDNIVITNNEFILPKEKLCYMTKEHKKYQKYIVNVEIKDNLSKDLVIKQNDRFNFDGESNEQQLSENNKGTYNYIEINLNEKENENNNKPLEIGDNSNINIMNNNKDKEDLDFTKNNNELNKKPNEKLSSENKEKDKNNIYEISNFNINYKNDKKSIKEPVELKMESNSNINNIGETLDKEKEKEEEIQYNNDENDDNNKNNNILINKNDINDINNNLKMENKENFSIIDEKPIKEEMILEKNIEFNILTNKENDEGFKQFNQNEITIVPNDTLAFEGNENILVPLINRKICYITKAYINKNIKDKEFQDENEKEKYIFKREDINNNNRTNNGLLITKIRCINNKNIQKEKIYKKPLFNEFYSFFVEESTEKPTKISHNLKSKPKTNKKPSKENIIQKEDPKKNKDKNSISQKPISNQNLTEKEEIDDNGLIKRIIPGKGTSSETIKIKPNHLLKVIKVQKGKTTYEQFIHVGKVIPKLIKEEDEEFIYIRYKSKTPQKKYIKNNLTQKYKDDNDVKKYIPKWKEDINLKTKHKIEESEENIKSEDSNDEDNKMIDEKLKLIKVYKFNYKNYCYASKIRKRIKDNNEEKEEIKEKEENIEKINDNDYIPKEEFRQNIIKNSSYITKDKIKKNTYKEYYNYYNNLNLDKIYNIPISYKNNMNIPNYITKIRHIKYPENKAKEEETEKQLNEKPINKLSLITKKRIKTLILPILDRTKISIDKCIITKEVHKNCLPMPNPKYKSEFYLITKKRKKIIQNQDEELELKLPSEQNNKCYITKERKFVVQKGTIIPVKKLNYIKKERKRIIKEEKIKLPVKEIYYMEKINKKEHLNEIKTIQNIYRNQKNKKNKDDDILFNNIDKNAFIIRKQLNKDNKDNESNDKDNNYIFGGYISKINKKYIYKLYPPEKCYISKESKFQIKNQSNHSNSILEPKEKNCSFLSLLEFFIKKNIDEYVFPKLKINENIDNNKPLETNYRIDTNQNIIIEEDNSETFTYPKYYKMLRRIFNFYKTQKREDKPEAKKIYDRLIPSMKDSKSLNDLITKLNDNPEETVKIIENLPNNFISNDDLIEEIGEFVKYDKNLSNSAFIKNKLKENPNMKENKTLFNIIKTADDEYNNLINGKYCYKCGKEILKCKCDDINYIFKETENGEETEKNKEEEDEDEDNFDFDDDDDEGITKTKKINYFEYDTNKKKGLKMINKPRLEDYITQPKKVLQICNRNQLNEINKNLRNIRLDSKNSNLKLSNNEFNSENNANQIKTINSNFINTYNSNNDDINLTSNNKNMLSSYNFK